MPVSASLQFGDNNVGRYSVNYLITDCRFHFTRHHNYMIPDAAATCESIEISVVVPGKADLNLIEWYIDQSSLSGRIVFDINSPVTADQDNNMEVRFENAQCFSLSEDYQINNHSRRLMRLSFTAEEVVINDISFKQFK